MPDQPTLASSSDRTPHPAGWPIAAWIFAGVVLLGLALCNYATFLAVDHDFTFQYTPLESGAPKNGCLEHGWPWTYARRDEIFAGDWNLRHGLRQFHAWALLANTAVALAIAGAAGTWFVRWRRKPGRWYQISLGTMLLAASIVGFGAQRFVNHRRGHDIHHRTAPSVSLELAGRRSIGPIALAGYRLPHTTSYAGPLHISIIGMAQTLNIHPGAAIQAVVDLDPAACRVVMPLSQSWQHADRFDWMYEIPVQDVHALLELDGSLIPLTRLPHLRRLWLSWPAGASRDLLATLGELPQLELLAITGDGTHELRDEDFGFLRSLRQLQVLALGPSQSTGHLLTYLAGTPKLRTLCLPDCPISDADLPQLTSHTALRRLEITSPPVSHHTIQNLRRSLPALHVLCLNDPTP